MSKVLVVEDDASLLRALSDKFQKEGYEVVTANNGQEGLTRALQEKPEIVLLDVVMPIKDGLAMLSEMRHTEALRETPVIILTNLNEPEKMIEGLELGVNDYLVKSDWKIDDVVKKVAEKLKKA